MTKSSTSERFTKKCQLVQQCELVQELKIFGQKIDFSKKLKKGESYSDVMKHIRTRLRYALLRATLIAIRGSRPLLTNRGELEVYEISFNLIPEMKKCCK